MIGNGKARFNEKVLAELGQSSSQTRPRAYYDPSTTDGIRQLLVWLAAPQS